MSTQANRRRFLKAKASKPATRPELPKIKELAPRKDPKGGVKRSGGDCDEFGCGTNHNEVFCAQARA